jgi:uncharacterized heparinase superfamily protein
VTSDEGCPGCGRPLSVYVSGPECDHCEYFNLVSGRTHYCGKDSCYCRALRNSIRADVLATFVDGKAAATYQAAHQARVRAERGAR